MKSTRCDACGDEIKAKDKRAIEFLIALAACNENADDDYYDIGEHGEEESDSIDLCGNCQDRIPIGKKEDKIRVLRDFMVGQLASHNRGGAR